MNKTNFDSRQSGEGCYVPNYSDNGQRRIARREQKLIERRERKLIEDKGPVGAAAAMAMADEVEAPVIQRRKSWFGWWVAGLVALMAIGLCLYFATRDNQLESRNPVFSRNEARTGGRFVAKGVDRNASMLSAAAADVKDGVANAGDKVARAADDALAKAGAAAGSVWKKAGDAAGNAARNVSAAAARVLSDTPADDGVTTDEYVATIVEENQEAYADGAETTLAEVDVYAPMATKASVAKASDTDKTVDYVYHFANNQSAVPENAILSEIAAKAKATGADITVTAHASNVGSAAYNMKLSRERAENIARYMVAHGVDASHVRVKAEGATTEYGDAAHNRRADIIVDYGA